MDDINEEFWKVIEDLVNQSEIVIDRPKGTVHPKYPNSVYQVDYGYLKGTSSMDGAGIDVWVGSGETKIDAITLAKAAPKRQAQVYEGLYLQGKTQKALAQEWEVTEKYIQILNKRPLPPGSRIGNETGFLSGLTTAQRSKIGA